ncbi:hypothetical protein BH10PLA2_BH10PLA2_11790 [soil metagenome]
MKKTPFMGGFRYDVIDFAHQDFVPFGPFQPGQGFQQPIVQAGTYFTKLNFTYKNTTTGAIWTPNSMQVLYSAEIVVP